MLTLSSLYTEAYLGHNNNILRTLRHKIVCSKLSFKIDNQNAEIAANPGNQAIDYHIRQAAFHELLTVVKLRIQVFYPEVSFKSCKYY